jgi:hypothetical protein
LEGIIFGIEFWINKIEIMHCGQKLGKLGDKKVTEEQDKERIREVGQQDR